MDPSFGTLIPRIIAAIPPAQRQQMEAELKVHHLEILKVFFKYAGIPLSAEPTEEEVAAACRQLAKRLPEGADGQNNTLCPQCGQSMN